MTKSLGVHITATKLTKKNNNFKNRQPKNLLKMHFLYLKNYIFVASKFSLFLYFEI